MGRRLERHIDAELVARIQDGWRPKDRTEPLKRAKTPRSADTYRAARRNAQFQRNSGERA
jgi:hypothetical protein